MANTPRYVGFSTADFSKKNGFRLTNIDLVKRDILNHIYTIKGERPMMPTWGTRIPMIAFEPLDEKTISIVKTDLREVIDAEPRVKLIDLAVLALPENSAIVAFIDLFYVEHDVQETLELSFQIGA